jgi:crotonobetainyl-CoA:carnitine CoA-transferase CaiB-like acyl-CoA transferase
VDAAWLTFVFRYLTARCALPATFHQATKRCTLAELRRAAEACGVAVCRVRTYAEVLAEVGWPSGPAVERDGLVPRLNAPWSICPGTEPWDRGHVDAPPVDAPLAGLRVVEVTSRLQGPLATQLLRMLGAEVVKVEPPGGDLGRYASPRAGSLGAAYLAYNRGKRVIEIDYKRADGQAELLDLVASADVFVQNWPSGRAEKLGLDSTDLTSLNPGLVYAHASGWGRHRHEPSAIAGDYLVQAHAGCGDGLNPVDEPAVPSRLTLVDVTGGLIAAEGILAGLLTRERTGRGCRVDTSLLSAAMTLQADVLAAAAAGHETGRCLGRPVWGLLDQPLATADGFLVVAPENEDHRHRLAAICDVPLSAADSELDTVIVGLFRGRPAADWEALLREAAIPATIVRQDLVGLPRDPRVADVLERVNDACWVPAAPWRFRTRIRRRRGVG